MNIIEIRNKIDQNNKIIENILTPNTFVLNNTVSSLLEENSQLQEQCPHHFEEGFCIYCDKAQEDDEND